MSEPVYLDHGPFKVCEHFLKERVRCTRPASVLECPRICIYYSRKDDPNLGSVMPREERE